MTADSNDDNLFAVLEGYLARVQAGESPDREAIVREHPELASALACLDALEQLAPPSNSTPAMLSGELEPTIAILSGSSVLPRDFGPYELLEEIGRGGMGVVYKARQKDLDRTVAVKMILASHLASPEHVRRFLVEARAAAKLRHANVVPIHEVGQWDGQHYFAMDYIGGGSLAQRIAEGPLDPDTAARLVAQVARAVAHLHREGIVHRDLKPSNILLDADENPYVTDFGLAKVFDSDQRTTTGAVLGTASYMAPEQASGRTADVGPACDVYSLGAMLFELLTGRPPFRAETPLDTLLQVLSQDPPRASTLNPRVPLGLERVALRCLAKNPAERYASADALADDLERHLRGEPLSVRPPGLVQRVRNWVRREPVLGSRLIVIGLFFLIEMGNFWAGGLSNEFHYAMLTLLALWAVTAVGFRQLLLSGRWTMPACYGWGTLDAVLLLAALFVADGAASGLVVVYPLLIVGAGLWFRQPFVWYMAMLSVLSYLVLLADFYLVRTGLQERLGPRPDRHVIFLVALVVLAWVVGYMVQRVRALSRFYGQKV